VGGGAATGLVSPPFKIDEADVSELTEEIYAAEESASGASYAGGASGDLGAF
jgi:hypothetical protein